MPTKSLNRIAITPGQSRYVLEKLLEEKRVSARDIQRYLDAMKGELQSLEERLELLRGTRAAGAGGGNGVGPVSQSGRDRRGHRLTPKRRAALRKQGLYLALMRQVPKSKRASFKALFREKGMDAALGAMKQAIGK